MSEQLPGRVAVLGLGTMGGGIAQVLARAGISTVGVDLSPRASATGRARVVALAEHYEASGLFSPGDAAMVAANLTVAASIREAVAGAAVIFEAVLEQPEAKAAALVQAEAAAAPEAVIASNTSAIPITELASHLRRPERFLGAHWFNPPQWVPCVEVVHHPRTSPEVVATMHRLLGALGKQPVSVADTAGFVANRIQFAMFKEAARVVADGVASAEAVDAIVRTSFGFRLPFYGPFRIADMAGLDVYAGAYAALRENLGERFAPPATITELAAEGHTGTKSGAGTFQWTAEEVAAIPDARDRAYSELGALLRRLNPKEPQ